MPSKNELLSEVCSLIIYISPELFKNWKNNSYYKSIGILRSITKSSSQYSIFLDIMTQIRSKSSYFLSKLNVEICRRVSESICLFILL